MYTTRNFKTKKDLKRAVDDWNLWNKLKDQTKPFSSLGNELATFEAIVQAANGRGPEPVRLFSPGIGKPTDNGTETVEGPHFPEPHRWYARVEVQDGIVIKVK